MRQSLKSLIISIPIAAILAVAIFSYRGQIDKAFGLTSAANYLLILLIGVEASLPFLPVG
jgi:hypothetical protein